MTVPSLPPRAPAPPVPSAGPGERPARPESVTAVLQLAPVSIAAGLVAFIGDYPSVRAQARESAQKYAAQQGRPESADGYQTMLALGSMVVSAVIVLGVVAVALTMMLRGHRWARMLVGLLGAVTAVTMVFDVAGIDFGLSNGAADVPLPAWATVAQIVGGVAAIGIAVAAMHPDTMRYVDTLAKRRGRTTSSGRGSRS
ncbi:hypothetical protein [Gordonia sp. FQ]|uniref:hypothetical protein n=1 Tax=Gordonia sp. FQ TaxID=3446634 RepID=UPI003F855146